MWSIIAFYWQNWSIIYTVNLKKIHDDVSKWKHFPHYWPFVLGIHWPPVNSPHKGQWRRALLFSLICAWINGWVNNREAGDLRSHSTHYDVTVIMLTVCTLLYLVMIWYSSVYCHCIQKIVNLTTLSSLVVPQVVITTTYGATNDDKVVKLTIFFQCLKIPLYRVETLGKHPFANAALAPVPLSIFRSNSKFDENSKHSSVKYTRPITTIFCTRHDSVTVVTCAKYRCHRSNIFETRAFWFFIEFRIRSKYA